MCDLSRSQNDQFDEMREFMKNCAPEIMQQIVQGMFLVTISGFSWFGGDSSHRNCDVHHHEDRKEVALLGDLPGHRHFLLLSGGLRRQRSHVVAENHIRYDW